MFLQKLLLFLHASASEERFGQDMVQTKGIRHQREELGVVLNAFFKSGQNSRVEECLAHMVLYEVLEELGA